MASLLRCTEMLAGPSVFAKGQFKKRSRAARIWKISIYSAYGINQIHEFNMMRASETAV